MRIGITGHQHLDDEGAWQWVREVLTDAISQTPRPFVGLSSLARGADQLFASLVIDHGGTLEVVLPFASYRDRFSSERDARQYDHLLAGASRVEVLAPRTSDQVAYLEAGKRIVDRSDKMFAVWNGEPANDVGGTGDIVRYAAESGRPILIFNPVIRMALPANQLS